MYKKCLTILLMLNMTFLLTWLCIEEVRVNQTAARQAIHMEFQSMEEEKHSFTKVQTSISSGQRVVDYDILEYEKKYNLSQQDYDTLLRIVEAEAGGEDEDGKLLVANVVLNRVNNEKFPNTVTDVVMQKGEGVAQFSPTVDGRFQNAVISEETYAAVERALYGEDISQGALYFCARNRADGDKVSWFDQKLTKLFSYGNHEFFF